MSQLPNPKRKTSWGAKTQEFLEHIFEPLDILGEMLFGSLWRTFYEAVQDGIALGLIFQIPSIIGKITIGMDFAGYYVCTSTKILGTSRLACYIIVTSTYLMWVVIAGRILGRFWEALINSLSKPKRDRKSLRRK